MKARVILLATVAVLFVMDRLTKLWIEATVPLYGSFSVIPGFFDIVHTKNRGAAFGMFANSEHPARTFLLIGVSLAVLVFIGVSLLRPGGSASGASRLTAAGLTLILGGALGNIYDRIMFGEVTDFLEFYLGDYRFAAFNVADSAITVGAALLILDMWRTRKQPHAA